MSTMTFWTGDWIDFPYVTVFTYVNSLKPIFTPGLNTYIHILRVIIIFLPHATIWNQFPPRVNDKSEGVGFKVEKQNKAMEKILKK